MTDQQWVWWQQPNALERWLEDFLRDALRRRGDNALASADGSSPSQLLDSYRDWGFSSLDMIKLASRFAACLGIDRTGLSDLLLARRSAFGWCDVARRSLQIDDALIGFYSSGSTGNPALSRHPLARLQAESDFFAQALPTATRVASTVPRHHIYGFIWGVLLPSSLGVPCITLNPATTLPATWAQQLHNNDLIVATPDIWQLLIDLDISLPKRFVAISSTAPLNPRVAQQIRTRYPDATLAEIYGSTETAGLGWRTGTETGYQLLPWWELDLASEPARVSSERFRENHQLSDRITRRDDGCFLVSGRTDDVVQIAGHNINLRTLAAILVEHPDIRDAKARYQFNEGHHQLHYFLALHERPADERLWCDNFARWLTRQLGDVPPPASIVVSDELPKSTLGKTLSWNAHDFPVITGICRGGFK